MSTSSHTLGPWTVRNTDLNDYDRWITGPVSPTGTASLIAVMATGNAELEANARLIAAAPELLAALQRLLDCPDLAFDAMEPESLNTMARARAAIAKATANNGQPL